MYFHVFPWPLFLDLQPVARANRSRIHAPSKYQIEHKIQRNRKFIADHPIDVSGFAPSGKPIFYPFRKNFLKKYCLLSTQNGCKPPKASLGAPLQWVFCLQGRQFTWAGVFAK